jgi:hypothetical protein
MDAHYGCALRGRMKQPRRSTEFYRLDHFLTVTDDLLRSALGSIRLPTAVERPDGNKKPKRA